MPFSLQHFRVFLASPGDVAAERAVAFEVIGRINNDPRLSKQMRLDPVAWDSLGTRTPMLASKTPQQAVDENLPRPSDCDIVVVVFWSRMGTPLDQRAHGVKADGTAYLSGTEWEYLDAMRGIIANGTGRPHVVVYRRSEKVLLDPDDPSFEEKRQQYALVRDFFAKFSDQAGVAQRGFNQHATSSDFGILFENDLRFLVDRMLLPASDQGQIQQAPDGQREGRWTGSPFPGLRTFTPDDAPIFFGRRDEIDTLARLVISQPFVAVIGASGSGKSSLVGAGLLPRLETLEESRTWMLPQWHHDSRQWLGLRCTPGEAGDDPFTSMAYCLSPMLGQKRSEIAKKLAVSTSTVSRFFDQLAGRDPNRKAALLFIDQFEELFTTVRRDLRAPFVRCLVELTKAGSLHMVVTMRSDFYHHCIDNPSMAALLERGTYPLSVPRRDMLREMIELPAERAGLTFEEGLVAKILDDMGDEPGNLPLMAYLLDELHRRCADSGKLTAKAYLELDGVRGAIGKRAEAVFSGLQLSEPTRVFQGVFRQLVDVDGRGIATRQRARLDLLLSDAETRALADAFTNARLLTTARDGSSPIIEVAHEALLQSWERLSLWIQDRHDDLRLYGRLQAAAFEWEQNQRRDDYLWSQERLEQVYAMQRRLDVDFTPIVKDFTRPEIERLLAEFERDNTPDYRQSSIVDRIARMGDVGVAAMCVAFDVASRNPRLRGGWSSMDLYHTKNRVTLHMHEFLKVHASTAISALINHLKSANNNQRGAAVVALGSIEATVSDHQLSSMEVNLGYNVQKQSPFGDPSVVPALLPLLGDPDATVRQNTIYALGLIGDRSAVPPLRHALEDGDSRVRANAAVVLGFFRDHAAEDTLLAVATADRDGSARRAAAMALGKLVAPAAIAPLIRSLGETEEEWKRERVRILLRQYKDDRADAALRLCPSPWPPDQAVLPGPLTTLSAGADSPHVRRLRGLLKAVPWTCTVGLGSALGAVSAGGSTQVLPTSLLGRGIVLSALALLAGLSGALLLGRAGRRSVIRSPFARLLAKMFSATTYLMFAVLVSAYGMAGMLAAHIVVSPRGTRMAFLAAILFGAGSILGWRLGRSMAMRRLWVRFATSRTRKPQPQVDA